MFDCVLTSYTNVFCVICIYIFVFAVIKYTHIYKYVLKLSLDR